MTDTLERIWAVPERNCTVYMSGNSPITAQDGPFTHRLHGAASEYVRTDLVAEMEAENQRLREATEYDADAAKGMTKIVDLGDGAAATIIDPRSFTTGGPEWVMRYGNPCSIRFVVASLLESYDGLLSDTITTQESVRRLRRMRNARAALRSTEAKHDD